MADLVRVKINGKEYSVERNTTILDACRQVGIKIPTLCYLREINEIGACRVCVVEVVGARNLVASCVYPIDRDGMEIKTNTKRVLESRKTTVELLLSNHNNSCKSCLMSSAATKTDTRESNSPLRRTSRLILSETTASVFSAAGAWRRAANCSMCT